MVHVASLPSVLSLLLGLIVGPETTTGLARDIAAAASPGTAAESHANSTCVRSGYVFIPCQQPANGQQQIRITSSATSSSILWPHQLQSLCDQTATCAAYTTEGVYYTVAADTGRVGPFKQLSSCQSSPQFSNSSACRGAYVFDGHMIQQQVSVLPSPRPAFAPFPASWKGWSGHPAWVPAPAPAPFVGVATPVTNTLRPQYVRAVTSGGGVGKVGKEQCELC